MVSIKGFLMVYEAVEIRLPVCTLRLGNQGRSRGRGRRYLLPRDTELSDYDLCAQAP